MAPAPQPPSPIDEARERELIESVAQDPLLQTQELFLAAIDQRLASGLSIPDLLRGTTGKREAGAPLCDPTAAHAIRVQEEVNRERARREARRLLAAEERGAQRFPEILTLRERLGRPRPADQWRIEGFQRVNTRGMVVAQYKSGKTTLTAGLIRSLVDGDPFLGRYPVTPIAGSVALIDTEMGPTLLDDWLRDQCIAADDRVIVVSLRGAVGTFDILDAETRAWWAAWLRQRGVAYVFLDCLRPVLDALGLDEHKDAGRLLVAFDALLEESNVPEATVVQHMGHLNERARGDSRMRDWPDFEIRLVRQDDDPASPRFLTAYGRDVDVPEQQLAFDPTTRRLTVAGGSRKDAKASVGLEAVEDVLRGSDAPLSGRAIEKALEESDLARDEIRDAIKAGIRQGRIVTQQGPKRATLHRLSGQCAVVRDECAAHSVSECAAAYIEPRTHTLTQGSSDPVSVPRTQNPWAGEPMPPGSAEAAARVAARLAAGKGTRR